MITKEQLQDLYKQGLSMVKAAQELNVSYVTIVRYTKKYGLKSKYTKSNQNIVNKPCRICGAINYKTPSSYQGNICITCSGQKSKEKNLKRKLEFLALKGNKCQICGYDKYYGALEFHHIKSKDKSINHQSLTQHSKELILEELKKCILVCSNCHREIHANLIQLDSLP